MPDSSKLKDTSEAVVRAAADEMPAAALTSDTIVETSPGFSLASLMISSAQSQSRAIESQVLHLNQTYMVNLATATQCVTRLLDEPSLQQKAMDTMIYANKV